MPTNNVPTPQSYDQILGDALSSYAARQGINDYNVGGAVVSFMEILALITARASGDIFQMLRDFSVDRATGEALQRLAIENGITPITAKPATGSVSVIDTSFEKISTKVYAGSAPPNIGSTIINVSDASDFPASGAVYLGRGTPNIEGPIAYSTAPFQSGNYWVITLNTGTTKFHNLSESVILAQGGNRSVPVNSIVIAPSTGSTTDIQYRVSNVAIILDGETTVTNVSVSALLPGSSGNAPIGGIKSFTSNPFPGATVTNPLPFTTGRDNETDDQLRVRIKRKLASTGLGTATAVKQSVIGAEPSDEQATVASDDIVQASYGAVLFIDDGKGYEAKTAGVGLESIVDSALGGEQFFQLATGGRQAPVAKAFLQSTISAPFDLIGTDALAVIVGGQTYEHVFQTADFRSPGSATAYEITTSINGNTTLGFEATTAGGGQYVVIRAKSEGNDSIQIAAPSSPGRDASVQMGLPSSLIETLRLYKNKIPLSKDGSTATVFSTSQQLWSPTIVNGDTLILSVDGTDFITYTITDGDFIETGLYTSVNSTNSLESWVQVFNNKLTGVTVVAVGQTLSVTSNLDASNRAAVVIDPSSTLVAKGMFTALTGLSSQGKASDYTLQRNTAQFELVAALEEGDQLTAGTDQTEARLQSGVINAGSITFINDAYIWLLVDDPGELIPTGVAGSTILGLAKPSANVIRYTSNVANAFANVLVGDYVVVWTQDLIAANRFEGRVYARTNTTLDILVTPAEYAAAVVTAGVLFTQGFSVHRSIKAPQKFKLSAGTYTLNQISSALQAQTNGLIFTVELDQYLIARSRTKDTTGSILVITADQMGQLLNWAIGSSDQSKDSLIAFYNSQSFEAELPLFIHSGFASGTSANPPNSFITSFISSISLAGRDPNDLIALLYPYGASPDAQPYSDVTQETTIAGATIGVVANPTVRRLRSVDRYYIGSPLDFGSQDSVVTVVDNDPSSGSFEIPLYRRAAANVTLASNPSNWNAYDTDSGPSASFVSSFASFNFANFKALMKAKKTLKPTPIKTALLYRSARWGRSGENVYVGYSYPSVPNAPISAAITVTDAIRIFINLKSGAAITTSIDASTEWNITVTPNTPSVGIDQVKYTWSGVGTAPALSLSGGEYVNITTQTAFNAANTGVFRVSTQAGFTPTATSFSVQMKNGVGVAQTAKSTQVAGSISFYAASATTAAQINTYVNANISSHVTSTIVLDTDSSGSGVILLSTYEDSAFAYNSVQLKDGINWIASSNLSGSPQFVFKNPLALSTDVGYAFNAGEEVRLIPTTMDQVRRFMSVLAVSGFTTVGTIGIVDRGTRLELATNTLGSLGSIQIIGGLGNEYEVPVLDSATRVNNSLMSVSANVVSAQGMHSDQWFRLQASNAQKKETLFAANTSATIIGNSPSVGKSTIRLLNRELNQRYFGKPRHHVRSLSRNFRIEKQGALVCLSWDNVGSTPVFKKASLNMDDSGGGTVNVFKVTGTSESQYVILTGNANFNEVSIGDLVTIAGMPYSANNGTFLVTGVSDDGKNLRVLNSGAANQFSHGTFTLVTNPSVGGDFLIGTTHLIAGTDFVIAGTPALTAANLSAAIGAIAGVTSTYAGNVVTVTANTPSANIPISYTGGGTITVSGAALVGDTFVAGNFSASSEVSEGDTFFIGAPFNVLNQGKYRVIRRYNDSIWFENTNVVEEEVTLPLNSISLGFDATTSFKVNANSNSIYLNWNGVGTEPSLANAQMGDVLAFGTDFAAANQGSFMVLRSGVKLQEITSFIMPAGSNFTLSAPGQYFLLNSAGDVNLYYVWFNVNGTNTDPLVGGRVGLQVAILSGDSASQVATKAAAVIDIATGMDASASSNVLTTTTTGFIETTDASNFNMPSPFSVTVTQHGRRTFLECINPSATNQAAVFISGSTLVNHRPQIQFFEYEATVPGDSFIITSASFGAGNIGTYALSKVVDRETAEIDVTLASVSNISLNGIESSTYVSEGVLYYGYKRSVFASAQPGAPLRSLIVFDTNAQYSKINESANIQMVSLNKLDFFTIVKNGLDSYRYNIGLIAEANRIIYGDPRDPTTYPGVGAAGATIFVREPLARRIQVGLNIRLNTGVPFAQTAEQVRNAVSALFNSNDIGQSIAISAIVAAATSIPGVLAVSVSLPTYNVTNDLIVLSPGEKAIITDPTLDISVSQVGS